MTTATKLELKSPQRPTFDDLCKICPKLRSIEYLVKHLTARDDPSFCAAKVWYETIKPMMKECVGYTSFWEVREDTDANFELRIRRCSLETKEFNLKTKDPRYCSTPEELALIRSTVAYEVAYQHLYNALPDCRHESQFC